MNTIFVVGGGKGGVGKSMVSMALLDALLTTAHQPFFIDSDDTNPDVYKAVNPHLPCEICNLDEEAGYILLGNLLEQQPTAPVVINTAARATAAMQKYGGIIPAIAQEMNRRLVMLWPINRQRDSLELLRAFLDSAAGYDATYAVLNTYFGDRAKFSRFDNARVAGRVSGAIPFPELADLVADTLIDKRLPLWQAEGLTIAERSALNRFRTAATAALQVTYG